MCYLVYSISYSEVPINSLPLTITLYSSATTTLIYNDTKYLVPFTILKPSLTVFITRVSSNLGMSNHLICFELMFTDGLNSNNEIRQHSTYIIPPNHEVAVLH